MSPKSKIILVAALVLLSAAAGYWAYQYYSLRLSFNPASEIGHFRIGSWPKFKGTVTENNRRSFFCFDCLPTMQVNIINYGDVFVRDCYGKQDFRFKKGDVVEVWGRFDRAGEINVCETTHKNFYVKLSDGSDPLQIPAD